MSTHRLVFVAALFLAATAPIARGANAESLDPGSGFFFPTTGVHVEQRALLLAIDDYLLPLRENLGPYLSKPSSRAEPVLAPSKDDPGAPDQVAAHFYGAVLHDGGKYRMWYYGVRMKEPGDARRADLKNLMPGPVCYAESDDGIHWTKPKLGQMEIRGRKDNNAILLPDAMTEGVHVIRDDADPDPRRRYKMVYNAHNGTTWVIRTATSGDGTVWKPADGYAIDQFLETASFYRFNGMYMVHGQRITFSDGGHRSGRQGRGIVSTNFDRWLPGDTQGFLLPEPADPAQRGPYLPYDQVHLGVGGMSFGNVCVGLYGIWHNAPGDEDSKKRWGWFGYGKISCDLGLLVSNDGLHYREPDKGRVFISRHDAPATPVPGKDYPTILAQSGNGILNVGDETRIYFGRWLNADYGMGYSGEVGLAILPRDRWGALGLHPGAAHGNQAPVRGFVWSAPVRLPPGGCVVALNADDARGLSVEISDARFNLLPEFSGERRGTVGANAGLDCAVRFGGDLAALGGRIVRFKINFDKGSDGADPRLFAAYLTETRSTKR
jgi:hypothetical protein